MAREGRGRTGTTVGRELEKIKSGCEKDRRFLRSDADWGRNNGMEMIRVGRQYGRRGVCVAPGEIDGYRVERKKFSKKSQRRERGIQG